MSEFLRRFVKQGLIDAIGKAGDHWVRLNAAGWHDKGVLLEEDLVEVNRLIDAKNGVGEESGDEAVV